MAPFVKSLPTYIKDTNHGLNTLKQFRARLHGEFPARAEMSAHPRKPRGGQSRKGQTALDFCVGPEFSPSRWTTPGFPRMMSARPRAEFRF